MMGYRARGRYEVLLPQFWLGAVVNMDNLSTRKFKVVRQMLKAAGAHLLYPSPYSPDFNSIEPSGSKLKSHLHRVAARTTATPGRAITEGLRQIRPQDTHGYFAHCGCC